MREGAGLKEVMKSGSEEEGERHARMHMHNRREDREWSRMEAGRGGEGWWEHDRATGRRHGGKGLTCVVVKEDVVPS